MITKKILLVFLFIAAPLITQGEELDYKERVNTIKELIGKQYQMWPDSSGSTKEFKRYLTCKKPKPAEMTDREYILRDDYSVDVVLSLKEAKVTLPKKNHEYLVYFSNYLFTSRGIDVYEAGLKRESALFVDASNTLRILDFDLPSSRVRSVDSYKCEDPGMVKLVQMKAREAFQD